MAIFRQLDLQLAHPLIRKDRRIMASAFHEKFLLEDCRQILMKVSFKNKSVSENIQLENFKIIILNPDLSLKQHLIVKNIKRKTLKSLKLHYFK